MSNRVRELVYSKRLGSSSRKSVLARCADRASDDGSGIWTSKAKLAREVEFARSTVFKSFDELVAEGLLVATGRRSHSHGYTVQYDMNLERLRAFPDIGPTKADRTDRRPAPPASPSVDRLPPVRSADPKPSGHRTQTILEPSMNEEFGPASGKPLKYLQFWAEIIKDPERCVPDTAITPGLLADLLHLGLVTEPVLRERKVTSRVVV